MGTPPPDTAERRDVTEMPDISDRVPGPADRKVFLSGDCREEHLSKAKTPHEQESIQRTIAATDKAIDALVYELYGVTEEKIAAAQGGEPEVNRTSRSRGLSLRSSCH